MNCPRVKFSGGKIVPRSDLRVGTTLGSSRARQRIYKSRDLKLGTWNVKSLNTGGLKTVAQEIDGF